MVVDDNGSGEGGSKRLRPSTATKSQAAHDQLQPRRSPGLPVATRQTSPKPLPSDSSRCGAEECVGNMITYTGERLVFLRFPLFFLEGASHKGFPQACTSTCSE